MYCYSNCDFGLESKQHPNHDDMIKDTSDFLRSYGLQEASEDFKMLELTAFHSRCFAEFPYSERLIIANRLPIVWYLIDDLRDDVEPTKEGKEFHEEHVALCRDESHSVSHPVLRALKGVFVYLKNNSNPSWYRVFLDSDFQCASWSHEMFYERRLKKPDFATALMCRKWDGYLYSYYLLHEFITDQYLPAHIRGNPCHYTLMYYTVLISLLYNDFVSTVKDLKAQNPYSVVCALQREKNLSVQETINEAQALVMKYFREFMAVKTRVDKLFVGKDLEIMLNISNFFHRLIQPNKDYSTDVGFRYFGNQTTIVSVSI